MLQHFCTFSPMTLVLQAMRFSHYHIALAGLLQRAFILFYCIWNHTLKLYCYYRAIWHCAMAEMAELLQMSFIVIFSIDYKM